MKTAGHIKGSVHLCRERYIAGYMDRWMDGWMLDVLIMKYTKKAGHTKGSMQRKINIWTH